MKVQIVITGQYMENYGAHDWDGKGSCPQYWKAKGTSRYPFASNVEVTDLPEFLAAAKETMASLSYHDYFSSATYDDVRVYPNRMTEMDMIPFDYRAYDYIDAYPKEELEAFLFCFGMEKEAA